MRAVRFWMIVVSICVTVACMQQGPSDPTPVTSERLVSTQDASGGLPMSATIEFGQPDTGSPFPAPSGHDQSSHAKDNLVPRTVVIAQGGTVTFDLSGPGRRIHQRPAATRSRPGRRRGRHHSA
jgi:hypothetical protein